MCELEGARPPLCVCVCARAPVRRCSARVCNTSFVNVSNLSLATQEDICAGRRTPTPANRIDLRTARKGTDQAGYSALLPGPCNLMPPQSSRDQTQRLIYKQELGGHGVSGVGPDESPRSEFIPEVRTVLLSTLPVSTYQRVGMQL